MLSLLAKKKKENANKKNKIGGRIALAICMVHVTHLVFALHCPVYFHPIYPFVDAVLEFGLALGRPWKRSSYSDVHEGGGGG